jgi:cytochrome c-type biogenesis protein CcmE
MATYEGLVPDTFKSGAEVVVQGNADEQDQKDRQKQAGGNAQQIKL